MTNSSCSFPSIELAAPKSAGHALYTRNFLRIYDRLLYGFNAPLIWRCGKRPVLDLYDRNVSARHLDVGVGTGLLLDQCRFPTVEPEITLFDANPNCLAAASERLTRYHPLTHLADALEPWGLEEGVFESVALTHLLHCLPGDSISAKAIVIERAREALAPGGVLFGATILGSDELQTGLSRRALKAANRGGAMSNLGDREADLDTALAERFDHHQVEARGAVALFSAIGPL